MGAPKRAFRSRLPLIFTVGNLRKGGFAASPIDTAKPQEHQRLETRHMGAPKRAFRSRLPLIFTVGNMRKGGFAASPIDTATPQEHQKLETRHMGAPKRAFRSRLPLIFTVGNMRKGGFCSFPHRHGEATGTPETQDETRWHSKTSISWEIFSNFDTLQPQNRRFPTIRNL